MNSHSYSCFHCDTSTTATAAPAAIEAVLTYMRPAGERPYNYVCEPPAGTPWENYSHDNQTVRIRDARHALVQSSVHREGFALLDAPSAVRDFYDRDVIVQLYYAEVAELACAVTGAKRAFVFDHLVRKREADRSPLGFGRANKGVLAAANGLVHNDYTEESGRKRLALVLGTNAAELNASRYSIVNVWRSIKGPVLDTPLAICDARTIATDDLVCAEVRYPQRTGEIYLLRHAPWHRWSYFSAMDRNEALVFKQYDSQVSSVARYTPHAAFDHPHAPPDAPLRESIEARCLVIYE